MALTQDEYDRVAVALRGFQANAIPDYNAVAAEADSTPYHVKQVWLGKTPRPKPPKVKVELKDILPLRQIDGRTLAIRGQRLHRGKARKCIVCNRLFTLLYCNGMCQACKPEHERNLAREYL